MFRALRILVAALLAAGTAASVEQSTSHAPYSADAPYDGRFTFVRLRWGSGGVWHRGWSSAWNHDYRAPSSTCRSSSTS